MKVISKRELLLIIILILSVISFVLYEFVYTPKMLEMTELQAELDIVRVEKLDAEIKIASIPNIQRNVSEAEEIARHSSPLFLTSFCRRS